MARQVSSFDDIIDSRGVIAYIEELESLLSDVDEERASTGEPDDGTYDEERETLAALKALAEEASSSSAWSYGETLIRDSYFQTYAEELADDIGAIDPNLSGRWPYTCIDWEQAARELQMDYMSVDFDGVTYWIRA